MNCREAEPLLNAYVDGELDLATSLKVEDHVAGCAACTEYQARLQDLRREIAGAALEYRPSAAFTRRVVGARRRASSELRPWWKSPALVFATAAAVMLLLLVPVRMLIHRPSQTRDVVESHIRSLMAVHLVDVPSSDRHTVKPWFQGKLTFAPDVPDLGSKGFVLIGGRLDLIHGAPAAAIVYKRRDHVINLFVSPVSTPDSQVALESTEGYHVAEWTRSGMRYWAVSDVNPEELQQFAQAYDSSR